MWRSVWRDTPHGVICNFEKGLPFDVETLTKLGPALGSRRVGVAVILHRKQLRVVGVTDAAYGPFTISILDPGHIIVRFAGDNIAAISGASPVYIGDSAFSRSKSIWTRVGLADTYVPTLLPGLYPSDEPTVEPDQRIDAILDIARYMRSIGHGGALLIVPENEKWKTSVDLPIQFEHKERKKGRGSSCYISSARELNLSRTIAQLTAVDGATVVTADLKLLAFGVKLRGVANDFKIVSTDPLDPRHKENVSSLEQLGGTRHQSVARFIATVQNALAIVVSQDGCVTAFVWDQSKGCGGTLLAHRRLELTLF